MRRLTCKNLFASVAVILTSLFVTFAINSTPVSAYNYSIPYSFGWSYGTLTTGVGNFSLSPDAEGNLTGAPVSSSNAPITHLSICANGHTFDPNSLIYFQIDFKTEPTGYVPLTLTSSNQRYSVVSTSFGEYGHVAYAVQVSATNSSQDGCLSFSVSGMNALTSTSYARINVSRLNAIILQNTATQQQIDNLAQQITSLLSKEDTIISNQLSILQAIGGLNVGGITGAINDTTEAVEDVKDSIEQQNNKDDQDRSNMNSQQTSIDSDASDSGDDASNAGTSLLVAFTSFVNNLVYAASHPSNNCNINMDMGNLNLGNVNLCSLSPPAEFQTLASIFLVLFCVPLSLATARKLISLIRSFQ